MSVFGLDTPLRSLDPRRGSARASRIAKLTCGPVLNESKPSSLVNGNLVGAPYAFERDSSASVQGALMQDT